MDEVERRARAALDGVTGLTWAETRKRVAAPIGASDRGPRLRGRRRRSAKS